MKATDCSLNEVFQVAKTSKDLAMILSFIQVEFGMKELLSHWGGFTDVSDHYGVEFEDKRDVANHFGEALSGFFDVEVLEFQTNAF
jgi:hypothetical protein